MNSRNNPPILGLSTLQIEIDVSDIKNQIQADQSSCNHIFVAPEKGKRKCCRCKEQLPVSQFNKDRSKKSGLQSKCRVCSNAEVVSWRRTKRLMAEKIPRTRRPPGARKRGGPKNYKDFGSTQHDVFERGYREEGMDVRERRHLSTHQSYSSRVMQHNSEKLEILADEILRKNQEIK